MSKKELIKNLWLMSMYCEKEIFRQTAKEVLKLLQFLNWG